MLYICIFSNIFDLIQAIRVSHTSLLWKSVNYGRNNFYDTGPSVVTLFNS